MWTWLNYHAPREWVSNINRSELSMEFVNGSRITLFSGNNYDAARGMGFDHVDFDEVQDIPGAAWNEVFRPALSDREGSAHFKGTPKGMGNWLYDLWCFAANAPGWDRHSFTTIEGGLVSPYEVESARHELDDRTFRQEYEASFEQYGGLVYYKFSDTESIAKEMYVAGLETWMTWDFNAGERPMSVLLIQKQPDKERYVATKEFVIGETNTEDMCNLLVDYFQKNGDPGFLHITGDSTGGRRESSASRSDWLIIEGFFRNHGGGRNAGWERTSKVTTSIRDRVNATNALFCNAAGDRRLFLNPHTCPKTLRGLQRVSWGDNGGLKEASLGEIDPTDALSYFPFNYFPVHKRKLADFGLSLH